MIRIQVLALVSGAMLGTAARNERWVVLAALMTVAAIGLTLTLWAGDRLMSSASGTIGYAILLFVMWWTMMLAMMLPSAAPAILTYAALHHQLAALEDRRPQPGKVWNRIPDEVRNMVVDLALDEPDLSPRELAVRFTNTERYFVSEASVYRILKAHDLMTSPAFIVVKAADEFKDKTTAPNQLWQTDFTYLKVTGWGWFYLSTVLDDFSRYIVAWKLCTTMKASDVTDTLTMALEAAGLDSRSVVHRPRLLSDNGSSYIAGDLADWLEDHGMKHVRGAPLHPQTQGKIERWHQTLKNRILLENYYLPGDLEQKIGDFVAHYNHLRYHESIANLTPADVYFGRGQTILLERERIKRDTIKTRRLQHRGHAA